MSAQETVATPTTDDVPKEVGAWMSVKEPTEEDLVALFAAYEDGERPWTEFFWIVLRSCAARPSDRRLWEAVCELLDGTEYDAFTEFGVLVDPEFARLTPVERQFVQDNVLDGFYAEAVLPEFGDTLSDFAVNSAARFKEYFEGFRAWVDSDGADFRVKDGDGEFFAEHLHFDDTVGAHEGWMTTENAARLNRMMKGGDECSTALLHFEVFFPDRPRGEGLGDYPTRTALWMRMVAAGNKRGVEATAHLDIVLNDGWYDTPEPLTGFGTAEVELYETRRKLTASDRAYLAAHSTHGLFAAEATRKRPRTEEEEEPATKRAKPLET